MYVSKVTDWLTDYCPWKLLTEMEAIPLLHTGRKTDYRSLIFRNFIQSSGKCHNDNNWN